MTIMNNKLINITQSDTDVFFSDEYYKKVLKSWDSIAKPLDGLGEYEKIIARIGAIQHTVRPAVKDRALLLFIADNGIVEEGVSQSSWDVTYKVAQAVSRNESTVCIMSKAAGVKVCGVDIGMKGEPLNNILNMRVREGTRNFLKEPAMTAGECAKAIEAGSQAASDLINSGEKLLFLGEMGIGNTTTATAVSCALMHEDPERFTGRGAGLSDEGLKRKCDVIKKALIKYKSFTEDPFSVLQILGGYDIAGMVGAIFAAGKLHTPVILDGLITICAALTAERICPGASGCCIASHLPKEPMSRLIIHELGLRPVIDASMALGEGTGAVMLAPQLDVVLALYDKGSRFENIDVEAYSRF